jgi:hypothetical protein
MRDQPLIIRTASSGDATALARLGTHQRRGHVLLAEQAGVPVAALALSSGAVSAYPTEEVRAALRLRRYQLLRQGGHVSRIPR